MESSCKILVVIFVFNFSFIQICCQQDFVFGRPDFDRQQSDRNPFNPYPISKRKEHIKYKINYIPESAAFIEPGVPEPPQYLQPIYPGNSNSRGFIDVKNPIYYKRLEDRSTTRRSSSTTGRRSSTGRSTSRRSTTRRSTSRRSTTRRSTTTTRRSTTRRSTTGRSTTRRSTTTEKRDRSSTTGRSRSSTTRRPVSTTSSYYRDDEFPDEFDTEVQDTDNIYYIPPAAPEYPPAYTAPSYPSNYPSNYPNYPRQTYDRPYYQPEAATTTRRLPAPELYYRPDPYAAQYYQPEVTTTRRPEPYYRPDPYAAQYYQGPPPPPPYPESYFNSRVTSRYTSPRPYFFGSYNPYPADRYAQYPEAEVYVEYPEQASRYPVSYEFPVDAVYPPEINIFEFDPNPRFKKRKGDDNDFDFGFDFSTTRRPRQRATSTRRR